MKSYLKNSNKSGSAMVIGLIIAAIVVIGGGAAFYIVKGNSNNKDNSATTQSSEAGAQPIDENTVATTTKQIKPLLAGLKSGNYGVKCSFKDKDGNGTFYVANDKRMRFDISTKEATGHMIRKGDTIYVWSNGQKMGFKFSIDSKTAKEHKYDTDTYVEDANKYDLKCQKVANLSSALFALPNGIKFSQGPSFTAPIKQ